MKVTNLHNLGGITYTLLLCVSLFIRFVHADGDNEQDPPGFPDTLTSATWDDELSEGLHIVEFYSPYCIHCRNFMPAWKEAWSTFHEEGEGLHIRLVQVNCASDGDLCQAQNIQFFPTVRLYGPNGVIKDYDGKRSAQSLIDFARKEAAKPENIEASKLKSYSKELSLDDMARLLSGNGENPYFVSFWPIESMASTDVQGSFYDCRDCQAFQKTWSLVSNKMKGTTIQVGHVNCAKNIDLCRELGFTELLELENNGVERKPQVALVLPERDYNNFFTFNRDQFTLNVDPYVKYAQRVVQNNMVPEIDEEGVSRIINNKLDFQKGGKSYVNNANINLIFSYDPMTVVQEDFEILQHLIAPLSELPNVYLYQSNSSLMELTRKGWDSMYFALNYNQSEPQRVVDEDIFALNTITQSPTFFLVKDGLVLPYVYPGYSTIEMRTPEMIIKWVEKLSKQPFTQITAENLDSMLDFYPEIYDLLAILVVDPTDSRGSETKMDNLMVASLDYEDKRLHKVYDEVVRERQIKMDDVRKLKVKGAADIQVADAMLREIQRSDNRKVLLSWADLSTVNNDLGWVENGVIDAEVQAGDVILIDKRNRHLYQVDIFGETLSYDKLYNIRETILSLLIPEMTVYSRPKKYTSLKVGLSQYIPSTTEGTVRGLIGLLFVFILIVLGINFRSIKQRVNGMIGITGGQHRMESFPLSERRPKGKLDD